MTPGGASLSGILLVDKPEGLTSHDMVARVRRVLKMKKVGHAGTLDPFATGLLILLVGEGTKLSSCLMDGIKRYSAEIRLGQRTDSADSTGAVIEERAFSHLNRAAFDAAVAQFRGTISQKPPMYSALKKNGQPLYKLARKGIEIEREARQVSIDDMALLRYEPPVATLELSCSKGTYVRTLAEDICAAAGTCGHLNRLRRLGSGPFSVEDALALSDLESAERVRKKLIPLADAVPLMPQVVVDEAAARRICSGQQLVVEWIHKVTPERVAMGRKIKVVGPDGRLLSIVESVAEIGPHIEFPAQSLVGKSLRVFNGL